MHIICRKLLATYFTSALIGLYFGFLVAMDSTAERAINFYGMTLVVLFYGGLIILVYGNVTSFLSEWINRRWLHNHTLPFVTIHALFGALFGAYYLIAFNEYSVMLLGLIGALLYALTDRVLYKRKEESKIAFWLFFSPPIAFFVGIIGFWISY